ncbi:MAG TPA: hypothetical protein VF193_04660 [Steroidobacter sp.]
MGRLILPVVAVAAVVAHAVENATLSIDRIEGDGWTLEGIEAAHQLTDGSMRIEIARLDAPIFRQQLQRVIIECPRLELTAARFGCRSANVRAQWPGFGPQSLRASITYGRRDGSLELSIEGLRLGEGTMRLMVSMREEVWSLEGCLQRIPVDRLAKLAASYAPLPQLSGSGELTASVSASGSGSEVRSAAFDGQLDSLTMNNESGSLASDKWSLALRAKVRSEASDWHFDVEAASKSGQAYFDPIFLDFGVRPLAISARGSLSSARVATFEQFSVRHTGAVVASGTARVDFKEGQPLRTLAATIESIEFPGAYESYLQPFLLDTSFHSTATAGTLSGSVRIEEGAPQALDLVFDNVAFEEGETIGLHGLNGTWRWSASAAEDSTDVSAAPRSNLQWESGILFGLELGPGALEFTTRDRQVRLLEPARIALLDGAIRLDSLRVRNAGLPSIAFMIDAVIEPVSVSQLCRAFGWPQFGGRVGGNISKLRYRDSVLTLGTVLHAQVFDGSATISDLSLEDPFGQWPRFYSNVAFEQLDLELVTSAFSFGRITGRLSGAIQGLELFNWTPVAFDARLYTPPGDRSRHRISQRAVETLGSLGGSRASATTALSSGFLRFFEDFNYDRLGLSCRLENEVCVMDGIAPAPNGGYYLVKGKGLPRIDVIGNSRRVDWPRLVSQLAAATQSGGPTIGR